MKPVIATEEKGTAPKTHAINRPFLLCGLSGFAHHKKYERKRGGKEREREDMVLYHRRPIQ